MWRQLRYVSPLPGNVASHHCYDISAWRDIILPRLGLAERASRPRRDTSGIAPAPSVPGQIDVGIRRAVNVLSEHGIETYESCEGGPGHSYPEPTVAFHGTPEAGWRAVALCLAYGLPVSELRRVWCVEDGTEPTGPYWNVVFKRRCP
jgi:hypothetical protein